MKKLIIIALVVLAIYFIWKNKDKISGTVVATSRNSGGGWNPAVSTNNIASGV